METETTSLSAKYLPHHHFIERHSIIIGAETEAIPSALGELETMDDPIIARLIALRELPRRVLNWKPETAPQLEKLHSARTKRR